MPLLASIPFPSAVGTMMDLLTGMTIRTPPVAIEVGLAVPPNYVSDPFILVKRIGGTPDVENVTDFPIMLIACLGATYLEAEAIHNMAEVRILTSPATEVKHSPSDPFGVLVDEASIYVGEQEIADLYPDERRILSTYRFGWRRQYRPS